MTAHEKHIIESYKLSMAEIKDYCKDINQSFAESHDIMRKMSNDSLKEAGKLYPNELQIMAEYCNIWIDLKLCDI